MKKVLITGASGWIGKHVVPLFNKDWEVHCVSSSKIESTDATWHTANLLIHDEITKLVAKVKPSHCVHLAWIATPGIYTSSKENSNWVEASTHLFNELISNRVEHITGVGSSFEYDWTDGHCIEDKTPLEPNTLYGQCKKDCGQALLKLAEQNNITATWARVFFVYGPDEPAKKLIAATINALLNNETVDTTEGTQKRDFLHVDDVGSAIHHLTINACPGAYNISSGNAPTVKSMLQTIEQAASTSDLIKYGARQMGAHEPLLIEGNNQKLLAAGWQPKYTLQSGMLNAMEWWKLLQ